MSDALRDLEAFMTKARDMVRLAQDLNDRLSATSSSPHPSSLSSEPEEATFIRSSLSQLGLEMASAPVTLDMIKDEKKWEEQLARELADVIQGSGSGKGILRGRGIIGLDEVWGGWNRARGICERAHILVIQTTLLIQVAPLSSDTAIDLPHNRPRTQILHAPSTRHPNLSQRPYGPTHTGVRRAYLLRPDRHPSRTRGRQDHLRNRVARGSQFRYDMGTDTICRAAR